MRNNAPEDDRGPRPFATPGYSAEVGWRPVPTDVPGIEASLIMSATVFGVVSVWVKSPMSATSPPYPTAGIDWSIDLAARRVDDPADSAGALEDDLTHAGNSR